MLDEKMAVLIGPMTFSLYIRLCAVSLIRPIDIVSLSIQTDSILPAICFAVHFIKTECRLCMFDPFFRPFMTFSLTLAINQEAMRLLSLLITSSASSPANHVPLIPRKHPEVTQQ